MSMDCFAVGSSDLVALCSWERRPNDVVEWQPGHWLARGSWLDVCVSLGSVCGHLSGDDIDLLVSLV